MPTWTLITAMPPSRLPGAVPTAPVGRLLAHALVAAGLPVRVLVPAEEAHDWPATAEIVEGGVTDPDATPAAFADVDRVFLAGLVSIVPERMRQLTNLLVPGPLARVVVLSSHGADFETTYSAQTWEWLAFERALEVHGASWVHLRPGGLFANAVHGGYPISGADWCAAIARGGPIREFLPDVTYPFIDEVDVAAIAARLLFDEPVHGTLDVVGCLSSARDRVTAVDGAALDPLTSEEQARAHWREQGWPETTIDVTLYAMRAFEQASAVTTDAIAAQIDTAARVLGRPPRTFLDWLEDHAACFATAPVR